MTDVDAGRVAVLRGEYQRVAAELTEASHQREYDSHVGLIIRFSTFCRY